MGRTWYYGPSDGSDNPALPVIEAALAKVGIVVSADDTVAHFKLVSIARLARNPPPELRLADPKSTELVRRLAEAAHELRVAIDAVAERAEAMSDRPETGRVDICQFVFGGTIAADIYRRMIWTLENEARGVDCWTMRPSRGRPTMLLFHEFARRISDFYVSRTGNRGFSERNGSAVGPLVDLIHEAQQVLPHECRHSDMRTIGKRLLKALAAKNDRDVPIFW